MWLAVTWPLTSGLHIGVARMKDEHGICMQTGGFVSRHDSAKMVRARSDYL